MKRRNFIRSIPAAGIMITTGTASAYEFVTSSDLNLSAERYNFELDEATIDELQKKMKNGQLTSRKITAAYLSRIREIDKAGPALNAIIELNPDALSIAGKMDSERKAGHIRGPLHGIPVLVKDNINTGDKMMTTAGSIALMNHHALQDAFIVKKLREAGAVVLGKTNCTEWSNFRSNRSASGWSSRGGQTKNACVLDRSPSGSSSGSAVAVAANLCTIAIGTETNGSIISPSSYNGIVGIKPTVGLWSRSGIIPISNTQDTAGPMARTVRDAAIFLGALCGTDADDPVTKESEGKNKKDYTTFLDANALNGSRIGIEQSYLEGHPDVVALYKAAIDVLKNKGATIVELDFLKSFYEIHFPELIFLKYEFKDGLNNYLSKNNTAMKSLADVIAFNKKNEAQVMPYFKQETMETSQKLGPLTDKEYVDATGKREKVKQLIDKVLADNHLDAICSTSTGLPCTIDVINGDYDTGFYFCSPAAIAGYPHITVPMGKVHGLPVGFSFISRAYREDVIIKLAYSFEQATRKREKPGFIKSVVPA